MNSYVSNILLIILMFISFISFNHWPYLKFLILFEFLTVFMLILTIFSLKSSIFFIFMFVAVCEAILSLCFLVTSSLDYVFMFSVLFMVVPAVPAVLSDPSTDESYISVCETLYDMLTAVAESIGDSSFYSSDSSSNTSSTLSSNFVDQPPFNGINSDSSSEEINFVTESEDSSDSEEIDFNSLSSGEEPPVAPGNISPAIPINIEISNN